MATDAALLPVLERVRAANASRTPLSIRGGGTKDFLGEGNDGEPLSLEGICGVVDYDPSELVVTVRAGTRVADLEATLTSERQMLAFEPPRFAPGGTIGGAVAAGLAGPRRPSVGGVRDFVLGVQLVSGRGELLRFGGRVMKNVAGFDVSRLVSGSMGTFGPVVEVSLKVLPQPATERTLEFALEEAAAIRELNRLARRPIPLSASSWWDGQVRIRLSGSQAGVDAACAAIGGVEVESDAARVWWDDLRDHRAPFLGERTPLWRIVVPATTPPLAIGGSWLVEWSGGLRWLRTTEDPARVRDVVRAAGGCAALWHGGPHARMFETPPAPLLALQQRLKAAFDPSAIFNRGRVLPEV